MSASVSRVAGAASPGTVPLIDGNHTAGLLTESEQGAAARGIGSFHVHRGHAFEGFELVDGLVQARCACGAVLDVAEVSYDECPDCRGANCTRCGGTAVVIDHAALEWRLPDEI